MTYFGDPTWFNGYNYLQPGVFGFEFSVYYEVGGLVVVPYSQMNGLIPHSTVACDLGLAKSWADNMSNMECLSGYIWDYSSPTSSYTYTIHNVAGGGGGGGSGNAYTTNTILVGADSALAANTLTYTPVNAGSWHGGGGGMGSTGFINVNTYSQSSYVDQYVVVKKSDISSYKVVSMEPLKPINKVMSIKTEKPLVAEMIPEEEKYDGLTAAECLRIYIERQRSEGSSGELTTRQLEVARLEWSSELKRLSETKKQKEERQVLVDLDDDFI